MDFTDKNVYVLCPANVTTGGVELMHQLVDYLRRNGRNAYVVYFGDNNSNTVPSAYQMYNISVSEMIPDDNSSCVVFPEGYLYLSYNYKKVIKIFWWMSVDNFYNLSRRHIVLRDWFKWNKRISVVEFIRRIIKKSEYKGIIPISLSQLAKSSSINAYQSEYARLFLLKNRFKKLVPLSDYINQDYLTSNIEKNKERVVLYNPKKGYSFTKRLIDSCPDIEWSPLINMTRSQMRERLSSSMVYIDFGNHPGKDRIPREAAMSGCCIITGKRGAANNAVDIDIPTYYKFEDSNSSIPKIKKLIFDIFNDYTSHFAAQASYRRKIESEKQTFENEIDSLFNI